METKQKFHMLFYPNKQRKKDGKCPLYVRIYVDSKRSEFATSHFIDEKHWDAKKMKVQPADKNAALMNAYLEKPKQNSTDYS